jgi:hypothetical protein
MKPHPVLRDRVLLFDNQDEGFQNGFQLQWEGCYGLFVAFRSQGARVQDLAKRARRKLARANHLHAAKRRGMG